jgi:hypothetical protein
MKITKDYLKQIIKEELSHLEEAERSEQHPIHPSLQGGPKTVEEAINELGVSIFKANETAKYASTMGEVIGALGKVKISFEELKKKLQE